MDKTNILHLIKEKSKNTLLEALGIEFTIIEKDYLEATMPVNEKTVQPYGILHGGASAALAETVGSFGSEVILQDTNLLPVGIELNINHLKSATSGIVTAKGKLIKGGRKLHIWQIDIFNEENKQIATSRLTTMVIEKP